MMIKAVVFDFDGVIVDSNRLKRDSFFSLFPQTRSTAAVIAEVLSHSRGKSRFEIVREILLCLGKQTNDVERLVLYYAEEYNKKVQRGIAEIGLKEDVSESLAVLSCKYHLYLNSSTYRPALYETIAKLEISPFFQKIYGGPPPKEDNLKKIMAMENAIGKEIVVVGDSEEDYQSAVAGRCFFIGISNEFNGWREEGFPMISNLKSLINVVGSLNSGPNE